MTTFTLIMAIGAVLVFAGSCIVVIVGAGLLWTGRRIGSAETLRAELATLRTEIRGVDESFESYRTRAAQRISTDSKRSKKNAEETEEEKPAPIASRDDIVKRFQESSAR